MTGAAPSAPEPQTPVARPGSPHSKQRIPLVGKCRWETRCAAGESTVPEPPGSILETRIPTQNHAAARFTPQQAEEAFVAADVEWNRREGQSKVLCPGPFQERPLHGISYRLSLFGFPMTKKCPSPENAVHDCPTLHNPKPRDGQVHPTASSGYLCRGNVDGKHVPRQSKVPCRELPGSILEFGNTHPKPKTARRPGSPHSK
jgi:hypothetical protein